MLSRTTLSGSSEYCGGAWANGTQSRNDSGEALQPLGFEDLRWVAYRIIAPCIIAGGLVGNLLNLLVLTRPLLNGVIYVYLSGLAVADLGVMLFVIPMVLRLNRVHSSTASAAYFHAHLELLATNSFMASSIFIVCFMTVDRYISVCLPTKFRSVHTKHNARLAIGISYVLGTLISCPLAALKSTCLTGPTGYSFQENTVVTSSLPWLIYLWSSETLVRFGPALILAFLNTFIIRKFRKVAANRKRFRSASEKFRSRHLLDQDQGSGNLRNRNFQEEKRLIVLLTSIIVTFFVTMTPSAFLSLLYSEQRDDDIGFQSFRAVANNLELGNFALNFYVYFLCSKEFRKAFRDVTVGNTCWHHECPSSSIKRPSSGHKEDLSRYGTTVNVTKTSVNVLAPVCEEVGGRGREESVAAALEGRKCDVGSSIIHNA